MRTWPALSGYSFVLALCLWAFAVPTVGWYVAVYVGWFEFYTWLAANVLVAYWLNQSRTHSEKDRFDDTLPEERVAKAQERYINRVLETRAKRDDDSD